MRRDGLRPITGLVITATLGIPVFLQALQKPLDHDEHQFVASAALIARDGLLPYRDFPYFHLPYLSYLYAIPFHFTDKLLLAARLLCAGAAMGAVAAIWLHARLAFSRMPGAIAATIATLFALALVTNPLFLHGAGRAWNHDFAILAALLSAYCLAPGGGRSLPLVAGVLIGLATGFRSTMVVLVPALAFAAWLRGRSASGRDAWGHLLGFGTGVGIAMLPALACFLAAPEAFLQGNLEYNLTLNPLYRQRMAYAVAMSFPEKIEYLLTDVFAHPRPAALALAYAVTGSLAALEPRAGKSKVLAVVFALCIPLLFAAALAPTPSWYQYYYATQAFLIAGTIAHLSITTSWRCLLAASVTLPMLAGAVTGARYLWPFTPLPPASEWTVYRVHDTGARLAALTGGGKVLTLGPIFALEGGATIYPELATGPFAWRTADLLPEGAPHRADWIGPSDLPRLLADSSLAGVLTGVEKDPVENLEGSLLEAVTTAGWSSIRLDDDLVLWRPGGK